MPRMSRCGRERAGGSAYPSPPATPTAAVRPTAPAPGGDAGVRETYPAAAIRGWSKLKRRAGRTGRATETKPLTRTGEERDPGTRPAPVGRGPPLLTKAALTREPSPVSWMGRGCLGLPAGNRAAPPIVECDIAPHAATRSLSRFKAGNFD